jgi:TRAP-type mannitol/chloroaromatic compound transport system permease small subunit
MTLLLRFSNLIDWLDAHLGAFLKWLILGSVLVSGGNAIVRKAFDLGSNAFLELQWYLFAAVFMLGAGYAFLRNAHVRIDFVSSRLSPQARNWIDIVGIVVFLLPLCALLVKLGWPLFARAYESGEMSQNAGGLIRWPVMLLIPLGMAILLVQAVSELIKRIAFLRGLIPDPLAHLEPGQQHGEEAARAEATAQQGAAR